MEMLRLRLYQIQCLPLNVHPDSSTLLQQTSNAPQVFNRISGISARFRCAHLYQYS